MVFMFIILIGFDVNVRFEFSSILNFNDMKFDNKRDKFVLLG